MSLFGELKRRNVFRMAGLYLVGAWLVVQVATTVLPLFGAPGWVARSLVVVLAIGFLPALLFAWVFELTPDGLKRDAEVPAAESVARQTGQRMQRGLIVLLVLALGFFVVDRFVLAPKRAAEAPVAADAQAVARSIAVLPFVNMSADQEQEYFSDGMTEELLNALAKVPGLEVTARTSVFSLKGKQKDVREIGKLLGVAYVLEGSVRKAGDEVRITAQLIRADNGFHLWSQTYDRKLEHVFDLQAELAGAIAEALKLPLGMGGDAALVSERSTDSRAYGLYLQARAAYRARGAGVKQSIELYRQALERDPKFAPAWAGLASSLAVLPWYVPTEDRKLAPDFMREAEAAGKRALELSPDLPQGHIALGTVYNFQWQWRLAEQRLRRALELAPNDPEAHFVMSDWLAAMGRREEALQSAERAVALDPLVPIFMNAKGNMLRLNGREFDAIAVREAARALAPDLLLTNNNLLTSYLMTRQFDKARALLDEMDAAVTRLPADDPKRAALSKLQAGKRGALRLLEDPSQEAAVRREFGDESVDDVKEAFSQDPAVKLARIARGLDAHTNGVDPIARLRATDLDDFRQDPRYIRLLEQAGFDAQGRIRD